MRILIGVSAVAIIAAGSAVALTHHSTTKLVDGEPAYKGPVYSTSQQPSESVFKPVSFSLPPGLAISAPPAGTTTKISRAQMISLVDSDGDTHMKLLACDLVEYLNSKSPFGQKLAFLVVERGLMLTEPSPVAGASPVPLRYFLAERFDLYDPNTGGPIEGQVGPASDYPPAR